MSSVLVTGGSGYLGQFLVRALAEDGWKVGFTFTSNAVSSPPDGASGYQVNLETGEGLAECFDALGPLAAVINCAAHSAPAYCESAPERCRALNVPTQLLDALDRHAQVHGGSPFLIHLSTDHVYSGKREYVHEGEELEPVNIYGRAKLEGEELIRRRWPRHAILRSSIIYGPEPPLQPVGRTLFLQFIDTALAAGKPTTFFVDEWRTPTYVQDLVRVCREILARQDALPRRTLNCGGPLRLSRVDMAHAVAAVRGYDPALVLPGSAGAVARTCATPADISMKCSALEEALQLRLMPFQDALRETFGLA